LLYSVVYELYNNRQQIKLLPEEQTTKLTQQQKIDNITR
jgi:hypothetical protein